MHLPPQRGNYALGQPAHRFLIPLRKVAQMTFRRFKSCLRLAVCGALLVACAPIGRAQDADRKIVKRVEPEYPAVLRRLQIGGAVRLKVSVRADGSVEGTEVIGGNDGLAASAQRAVAQWKFSPASKATVIEVKLVFDPTR
jgi:TonB family protein